MRLSDSEKVKRHRARKRAGEAVLPIRVNVGAVGDFLLDHGFIAEWDMGDRDKIREAIESALRVWSSYETA
jgi:hypothetical protein